MIKSFDQEFGAGIQHNREHFVANAPAASQIYYGWKIVAAILFILTFTSGLGFYNHAVYLNALATRPDFDVQSASIAVSVFFFSGGIGGVIVARFLQHYDPRLCITTGAIIAWLSLSSLALVSTLWQLILVYACLGIGFAASALIPATTLVTRWFRYRRARALSIASTGLSLGGVVLTPLCVLLVERLGFTTAAPVIGAMYLFGVVPATWLWLRPSPESMGLVAPGSSASTAPVLQAASAALPGTESALPPAATQDMHEGISFREARRGRFFWSVSVGYVFLMLAQVGGIAHQYGLARELLSEAQTALAVAILPVASIIGRLLGGWVVDQFSIRNFAIGMMVLQALSLSLLAGGFNVVSLCIGLAIFGATVGNLLMLQPLIIAEAFGTREYARIFSISNLMTSWGTATGPALLGLVYANSGHHYAMPYLVAAAAGALGMAIFLLGGKIPNPHH